MTDVTVRVATAADIGAVLALWSVAAENAHRPVDSVTALEVLLERDPDALLLAVEGDEVVGTVVAGWDGWRGHLYRLAVRPDRRRRGVAGALIATAEARLRALGAGRCDAMVLDDNELARPAWHAAGYTRQPEWSRWIHALS